MNSMIAIIVGWYVFILLVVLWFAVVKPYLKRAKEQKLAGCTHPPALQVSDVYWGGTICIKCGGNKRGGL